MLSDKGRAAYAVGKERVHLADSVVGAAAGDVLRNHRVRGEGCARLFPHLGFRSTAWSIAR